MNIVKQSTTDFSAAGKFGRWWNQAVPFFNANIQGPRQLYRAYKENPMLFAARWAEKSLYAALLWYWVKDEDWWKELTDEERYLYSWIPMEIGGRKHLMRIPRAFEADGISMAFTQALFDSAYEMDPEAIKGWFATLFKTAVPLGFPTLAAEYRDQIAGEGGFDHFWGRPIVNPGLTTLDEPQQFNAYTTETAKWFGKQLGISPIRAEHFLRGVAGNLPLGAIQAGESFYETARDLAKDGKINMDMRGPEDIPLFGKLFNRGGAIPRSPKSVQKIFDLHEDAFKKRKNETPEQTARRRVLQDAKDAVIALQRAAALVTDRKIREELLKRRISIAKLALEEIEQEFPSRSIVAIERQLAQSEEEIAEALAEPEDD